ncbi:MAG TPA: cytochrome c [Polyangiaceae bacterium]|jgi:mono/diheme cytochrome c family protein|nr:cytochrome c [Polyangiaceae bacterium]
MQNPVSTIISSALVLGTIVLMTACGGGDSSDDNTPAGPTGSQPSQPSSPTPTPSAPTPSTTTSTPTPGPAAGDATQGKADFNSTGCAVCHGANADGIASTGPNITGSMTAGIGSWTLDDFTKAVRLGTDDEGMQLCANMLKYNAGLLSDAKLANIFAFVQSQSSENMPTPAAGCGD